MLQLLFLAVIVGLIAAVLVRNRREGFSDFDVPFALPPETGPSAIHPSAMDDVDDDPQDVPWIASWSPADHAARRGQNCLPSYREAGPDGTMILTVSKSCEAGMAHTRDGDRVIIPDSIPLALREPTLRHEMVHIDQRRHPDDWTTFYRRNWAFRIEREPPTEIPDIIRANRRANPDTWTAPWACWMDRYWVTAVYDNPDAPDLRSASTVWWDSWRREIRLTPPEAWTAFFGQPSQTEHPHEIAACLLVSGDTGSEAGRRLLSWWRSRPGLSVYFRGIAE